MSCNRGSVGGVSNGDGFENCVCDVISDIIAAQDEVANNGDGCCSTSCERSIDRLLSPTTGNGNGFTTVPFILYCKGDCKPFIGTGVTQEPRDSGFDFDCVESPILRAKKFVDDEECCVKLELLEVVNPGGNPVSGGDTVCEFFRGEGVGAARNLRASGVCITVDLDCFCAITCLDPITPVPAP
ncbi:CotY/CotZ family spore coat protein [Virgibacillus salinus]|uniref:Spore coat protein Z n=1 Tax=Virgibacillus salinus TaxID=553311 RepID=A0A1H1FR36_9BACI|nr:CotY/CotZ family spore coat protein [Virgibacillus salinus]SDR03384.1 spore coat protein Z [Virgibacillus salinus]